MRNKAYWKRRASQRTTAINQLVDNYEKHLVSAFYQSVQNINDEIAKLYAKYAKDNSITYQEALLYLTDNERAEFQQDLQAYIKKASDPEYASQHKKELDSLSVRARVKRLEQMAANIMMEAEKLHNKLESGAGELFHKVYEESYYQTAFDTFKGRGIGVSFDKPSPYVIDSLLEYPWAGKSFSANVWDNERKFESKLNSVLTTGLIQGRSVQQMAKDLADAGLGARRDKGKYGGSLYDATRLVRTEANFVANQATAKMYDQLGVDEYEYLATLSDRTCERCGELDGKHWPTKDQVVGVNYPPIHANCRCTTIPYFDDLEGTRTAQTADGAWYEVPGDMTYTEWRNSLSEDEKGRMTLNQKMAQNRSTDKEQYEKYKAILGKNAPRSFAKFQQMKYNDINWELFKRYSSSIKSGELTPLADFELYRQISMDIEHTLVGVITQNGIKIKDKSSHFISRVIGSVEQKRNGVSIESALDALTNTDADILPIKVLKNGTSQKFRYNGVEVSINPKTGKLIQANPLKRSMNND